MPIKNNENGFTVIEVIIAILIMTIGILSLLSAISYAAMRGREAEQRNTARQLTNAALESIFATRDLQQVGGAAGPATALDNWETAVANTTPATPLGIFLPGYNPIREDSGRDGIEGTADDACQSVSCVVGAYTNSSPIIKGYEREIIITNIFETNSTVSNRRNVVINVRYSAGQVQRIETVSTIISKTLDN
jgi:type II secretory pathway pseudopilin PulG